MAGLVTISMRNKDPFEWIKQYETERVNRYKVPKEVRNPQLWDSTRYDFTDPAVWKEYVPHERCTVGACISAIRKNWDIIQIGNRAARRDENETVEDIMIRINRIQRNLGVQPYRFLELEEIGYYDEQEEDEARQRAWGIHEVDDYDEPVIYSEEEIELRREEIEANAEVDDW